MAQSWIPPHVCCFFLSSSGSYIPTSDNFNCPFSIVLSQFYVTTLSDPTGLRNIEMTNMGIKSDQFPT
jgi:hypothetical protein